MKKVLIINTIGLNYEGITTVIFNYSSHICLNELKLEFVAFEGVDSELKKKFEKIGMVHEIPNRKKNLVGYIEKLRRILKHGYDVIHIHGNSGTMLIEVTLAKFAQIRKIIIHSHSTKTDYPIANKVMSPLMNYFATDRLACSKEAGEWLYGKKSFRVLNNAIETKKFVYNSDIRSKMRTKLEIRNKVLIGHIGHFSPPKNHFFLIEIFKEINYKHPQTKLLLVSDGPFFEEVKKTVVELGLADVVIFTGRCEDTVSLYQAMDIFVLPSKWEGLPLVTVEAQAADLPILVSNVVPEIARCTENIEFYSLEKSAGEWADKVWSMVEKRMMGRGKGNMLSNIVKCGYDIETEAKNLEKIYLE